MKITGLNYGYSALQINDIGLTRAMSYRKSNELSEDAEVSQPRVQGQGQVGSRAWGEGDQRDRAGLW